MIGLVEYTCQFIDQFLCLSFLLALISQPLPNLCSSSYLSFLSSFLNQSSSSFINISASSNFCLIIHTNSSVASGVEYDCVVICRETRWVSLSDPCVTSSLYVGLANDGTTVVPHTPDSNSNNDRFSRQRGYFMCFTNWRWWCFLRRIVLRRSNFFP